jgi:hypothetical protein
MKHIIASAAIATFLVLPSAGLAFAGAGNPSGTGQPLSNGLVECPDPGSMDPGSRPGNAVSASGSAFNPDGQAGTVYAGEQDNNNNNPKSVSQYDVACFRGPPG